MMLFLIECLRVAVGLVGLAWMLSVAALGGWVFGKIWKMVWREN